MSANQPPVDDDNSLVGDDFFEQILSVPTYTTAGGGVVPSFSGSDHAQISALGLGPGDGPARAHLHGLNVGVGGAGGGYRGMAGGLGLPLGLRMDDSGGGGVFKAEDGEGYVASSSSASSRINEGDSMTMTNLFPSFPQMQPHGPHHQPIRPSSLPLHQLHQPFQGQSSPAPAAAVSHLPTIRPRVRARRGQATDPHSIAERMRRERIAERMKALQELVPSCNKTDRAAMLDEIVDYVKFLRLQVKVLSMSRLGGADAVAQLVADVPPSSLEVDSVGGGHQPAWEKWSNDGTEQQVAKLLEEDVGAALQFLQSKALCIMPISLASAIFQSQPTDATTSIKPESSNV
ncbi:hypothetical protein Drorol1_Dr00023010 [Drosera rotundifolia]